MACGCCGCHTLPTCTPSEILPLPDIALLFVVVVELSLPPSALRPLTRPRIPGLYDSGILSSFMAHVTRGCNTNSAFVFLIVLGVNTQLLLSVLCPCRVRVLCVYLVLLCCDWA